MSPLLAMSQLIAFDRGLVGMTEGAYDEAFDTITGFLEQTNNHRYRLLPSYPADEDEEDSSGDNR